jgi:pyruvate/2-oxoglutarate dehydrogenase complex dihydrolipoamide acyltransferase (E2) component
MAIVEALLPQFGMGMQDAEIVKWLKSVGDPVAAGEALLEIEAAKAMVTVPSPTAGTLVAILVPEGQTVSVRTVLAHIEV